MNLDQKLTSPRLRLWNVFFDQHSCCTGISQAHRFHSSPLRLVNRFGTNRLLVERCQLRAVIGDEHSEQARRLFCARILTDEMATSGRLKEDFTGLVDFDRSGRGILGTDRPREYISEDASGTMAVILLPGTLGSFSVLTSFSWSPTSALSARNPAASAPTNTKAVPATIH
jgi:hypothetical protein